MARLTADERRRIGMLSPRVIKELEVLEAERAELVEALRPYVTGKHCFPCTCDAHNEAYARAAELLVRMEGK